MKTDPNHAAFTKPSLQTTETTVPGQTGLTKREYFAALAMQGFTGRVRITSKNDMETATIMAVEYADALIEALNKDSK